MKVRSIKVNSFINAIKSLVSIIFPLITFKYVSSVLLVDNMGKYNFSVSFISYFSLIASLGINAYAIRTGARIRDNKEQIETFAGDMFSINVISTVVSYLLLFSTLVIFRNLDNYKVLILILSTQILFKTIGVEWLYSIFEDYLFVTIRSILIKLLSLILVFIFVRDIGDLNNYAWITVIATAGNGIIDFIFASKHCRIRFGFSKDVKEHLVPILLLFAQNISLVIYVQSDTTILGLFTSDYYTGLYSLATNIYTGIKTVLCALVMVAIPRLSYYLGKNETKEFLNTLSEIFGYMMTFVFPIIVGVIMLSQSIILVLADKTFLEAETSIVILCASTLFAMLSYIYGQCILLPMKQEKIILLSTAISATVNLGLNFVIIPTLKHNGAALTTLLSEATVFLISWSYIHKTVSIKNSIKNIIKPAIGTIPIIIVCSIIKNCFSNAYIVIILSVVISAILYYFTELVLKNEVVLAIHEKLLNVIKGV